MRGELSETSVADLCRRWGDAGATGAAELDTAEGTGRIFFREGAVTWAASPAPRARLGDRLVNGGLLSREHLDEALASQRDAGEGTRLGAILVDRGLVGRDAIRVFVQEQILDALFELLRWRQGSYVFRSGEVADEALPVELTVDQLLVELSRRQSEWDQIRSVIPDLGLVPDFVSGGSSAAAALEPDEFAILASVDGRRSVRELADDLGYSRFEAARIIYGLALLGVVDVGPAAGPVTGTADDEAPAVPAEEDTAVDDVAAGDEAWTVTIADPDTAEDAGAADEPFPAGGPAAARTPPAPIGDALDDDDFDALLNELAAGPDPAAEPHEPAADEPTEPAAPAEPHDSDPGGREPSEPAPSEPGPSDPGPSEPAPSGSGPREPARGPRPSPDRPTGDVSEFLRELSQLALDDDRADDKRGAAGPRPRRPTDGSEPSPKAGRDAEDAPPRPQPSRQPSDEDGDDRRKRGIFGWGR